MILTIEMFFLVWVYSLFSNRPTSLPSGLPALAWHLLQFSLETVVWAALWWERLLTFSVPEISSWAMWRLVPFHVSLSRNLIKCLALGRCSLSVAWELVVDFPNYPKWLGLGNVLGLFSGYLSYKLVSISSSWCFCSKVVLHWKSSRRLWKLCKAMVVKGGVDNKKRLLKWAWS